ncbi:MAG: AsmA family protein [Bdellovibrionia bacterium]
MNLVKKLAIVFGILIGLFVIAAIAVPLFVDVDKYRPQIVNAADQRLNGKLELGKLSLSLWGQVKIQIDGLQLTDTQGNKVVAVKDAYFHLPFSSILSGSPALTLNMQQPALNVVKDKSGKLNVMNLMKESPAQAAQDSAAKAQAPQDKETKLPGLVANSRLGMEINNALLTYKDELLNSETKVSDLNVKAKNLSLSHEMSLEVVANLDSETKAADKKGGDTVVKGPIRLTANADPKVSGGKFQSVDLKAKMSLDDLDIRVGQVFHKAKGVDAHADLTMTASPEAAEIKSAVIKFFNAEVQGKGSLTNLSAKDANGKTAAIVNFSMKSNTIELKPWNQLVPMLTEYELGGNADLSAEANGPADKLGYKALLKVNALTAKAPNLKAQPKFDATISVVTDQIDHLLMTMSAPGNDLKIQGKVVNFQAPKADFQVTSTGMDLDQLVNFPPPAEKKAGGEGKTSAPTTADNTAPKSDLDASVEPLRTNKAIQNLVANIGVNIHQMKAKGVVMSDITSKMSMRDLVASVDSASMRLFNGGVKASFSTNLRPKAPTYKFDASVSKLDIAQAVASQFQAFKNTLTGLASFDMSGTGASFNTEPAMSNLNSKGKFRVENAVFTTLDVGKMVSEGLNGAIGKIADKIPALKGKTVASNQARESRYDVVSSDFTIHGGQFTAPNFVAKAAPNKGIDLKGDVAVGLKDQSVKANFEVIDTYNVTHAKDISVNQSGVEVNHILAEGNGPVRFPVSVGCTLMAPCYSYTQVPEFLAKVAMNNAMGGLKSKAKSELQNKAKDILKGLPSGGGGNNPLSDIGKKLFGH